MGNRFQRRLGLVVLIRTISCACLVADLYQRVGGSSEPLEHPSVRACEDIANVRVCPRITIFQTKYTFLRSQISVSWDSHSNSQA